MTKKDLNQSPYFDDYNEDKKYYRILFKPGRAVQARELTQIQSMIQKQIDRVGNHLFKNGSQVLPGTNSSVVYTDNVNNGFIKLPQSSDILTETVEQIESNWLNKIIVNGDGIKARVVGYREPDGNGQVRLFVTYLRGANNNEQTTFRQNQTISTEEIQPITATIVNQSWAVGRSYSVAIEKSVYFFNNNFVLVDAQTLFITPFNESSEEDWLEKPTTDIVLKFTESFITSDEDESLYDNSLGTTNYTAPGADRLRIDAKLEQQLPNTTNEDSTILVKIRQGTVTSKVTKTDYNVLEDTLARRTFDESGDYAISPFQIEIKDFLREDNNDGAHSEVEFYFESQQEAQDASVNTFLLSTGVAIPVPGFEGLWAPGTSYDDTGDITSFKSLCRKFLSVKVDPGKAYVKGYEIEKLSTSIVDLPRSRTLQFRNNKDVPTPLGDFFLITDVWGSLDFSSYDTVDLYDAKVTTNLQIPSGGSVIGTARVLSVEFFGGNLGTDSSQYRLFLFDINLKDGKNITQVQSLYSSSPTFTANCVPSYSKLTGNVSGTVSENIITGEGTSWATDEDELLKPGDLISVRLDDGEQFYIIDSVDSDNQLTLSTNLTDTFSNKAVYYVYSNLRTNSDNKGLVFNLPNNSVATLRTTDGEGGINSDPATGIDVKYTTKRFYNDQQVAGDQISLNLGGGDNDEEFEDFSINGYVVISSEGKWMPIQNYISGNPTPGIVEVEALSSQVTFYFNGFDADKDYDIIVPIVHPGSIASKEKSKTLVKGTFIDDLYSGPSITTTGSDVNEIFLGKCDILKVTRVVESPDYGTEPSSLKNLPEGHKDITGLYILDNGQRDYYYDIGKVSLRPGSYRPRGRVRVEFDYFTHGISGGYFCVDSYPTSGTEKQMDYSEIPEFISSDGTSYELSSAIDFRPRVDEINGLESGGFSNYIEPPKDNFTTDYHFYEGRIDLLYLDRTGNFYLKLGDPSSSPIRPEDPETGMTLYELSVFPYTESPGACLPKKIKNRRYTMKDIGNLENRIKNLEYYTSLSLLEIDTEKLKIQDALGNEKFKNGFLVDNFSSFNGELTHQDYSAAIDNIERVARPGFKIDNVDLVEKATSDAERSTLNYQKTGEIITLPYTKVSLTEQRSATKVGNINPYNRSTYAGSVKLTPWSDQWRDTQQKEALLVKDDSAYQAARQSFGPDGTRIDYTTTETTWSGIKSGEKEAVGLGELQVAGHAIWEKLKGKERRRFKQEGIVTVPEGYSNAGQIVRTGRRSYVAPVHKVENYVTATSTTTQFTSSLNLESDFVETASLGTRIIETSIIEYMRSIYVYFEGRGFMPGVRLYAFFNGVDVNEDCAPNFEKLEFDDITLPNYGGELICNEYGRIYGVFKIPNREGKRFKTGDATFRLTTSKTNSVTANSFADMNFVSRGFLDITQESKLMTRQVEITSNGGNKLDPKNDRIPVGTTFEVGKACPKDPIAQSFFVGGRSGVYISDIDVFFYSKDRTLPVTLELRPLSEGGLPSNIILPFGRVVKEAAEVVTNVIDVENNTLTVTGNDGSDSEFPPNSRDSGPWPNADGFGNLSGNAIVSGVANPINIDNSSDFLPADDMIPTRFTFESPIYLSPEQSYCFVLLTDSETGYNVWLSESGVDFVSEGNTEPRFRQDGELNKQIGTSIDPPRYDDGIYFKSENGISWTTNQDRDIKFNILKCQFDTTVTANVTYVNPELPLRNLTLDPLEFKSGENLVRVLHQNHGLTDEEPKSRVVFSPTYDLYLSGSLSTNGGDVVTGTDTKFTTELGIGSVIQHPVTKEQKVVKSITSDTEMTVDSAFQITLDNQSGFIATSYQFPSGVNLGGIDSEILLDYRGFQVQNTELDYYLININEHQSDPENPILATSSGRFGGRGIRATENKRFDEITILSQPLSFPDTNISWSMLTTTSVGPNNSMGDTYELTTPKNFIPNQKVIFDRPMHVSSWINQRHSGQTPPGPSRYSNVSGPESLRVIARLTSKDPNLSPVIDESRLSAAILANRLDNPYGILSLENSDSSSVINSIFDDYQCLPTTENPVVVDLTGDKLYFVSGETTIIKTSDENFAKHLSNLDIGKYVTISVAEAPGTDADFQIVDKLITKVINTPNGVVDSDLGGNKYCEIHIDHDSQLVTSGYFSDASSKIIQKDRFIDEISPDFGSVSSKYVSRVLLVNRSSNSLKILFDAHRDSSCEIDLYYRLQNTTSTDINNVNWTKAEYSLDVNGVITPAKPDPNGGAREFSSYESHLIDLPDFVAAQCKIVMRGGNTSRPPMIRDFRMIILDE